MSELLEKQLKELNGDARETARKAGAAAIPVIQPYLKSESEEQRSLALECFAEIKGDEAINALVQGLEDPDINVRKTAALLLHTHYGPAAKDKLEELVSKSPYEWVRGNAALVLGRIGNPSSASPLKLHLPLEVDEQAKKQMILAIARLEDGEARQQVLARLSDPNPRQRYHAIEDFEYIKVPALLPKLEPLLKDTAQVRNVGTEPYPVWHRVCDRAVEAVPAITGKPLPFPIGFRNYTPGEIDKVREQIGRSKP
jgi:HEAT repeat protein